MATVFLGLGSNLGDRKCILAKAISALGSLLRIEAVSSLYESAPFGNLQQPRFLNLVCQGETDLAPEQLLVAVKGIEVKLGRQPSERWGPRQIDIDILLYGQAVVRTPILTIPHAGLGERAFVLAPLAELAPDLLPPTLNRTIAQLYGSLPLQDVRRLTGDEGRLDLCTK
ncbi:MAG: 2-amino-4-hydroxy-6-hydroxymethyldihydropteridine diphosphokinase [Chloroflexota bacterium]